MKNFIITILIFLLGVTIASAQKQPKDMSTTAKSQYRQVLGIDSTVNALKLKADSLRVNTLLNGKVDVSALVPASNEYAKKTFVTNALNNLLGVDSIRFDSLTRRFWYLEGDTWYAIAVSDSTIVPSSLLTGLVGYYKLDEASGALIDATSVRNGTNSGAVANSTGKIGTGYDFDTNTDYLYFPYTSVTNNQTSLSFWFNLDVTPATAGRSYNLAGSFMANYTGIWRVEVNTGNQFLFYEYNSAGTQINYYSTEWLTTSTGVWYHCVVIFPAVGEKGKIYLNGVNVSNVANETFTGTKKTPDFRFYLGNMQSGSNAIDGKMDEYGVWNRALTEGEISILYNTGSGKTHPFTDL